MPIKWHDGTSWTNGTIKIHDGTSWVTVPGKYHDGSSWVTFTFTERTVTVSDNSGSNLSNYQAKLTIGSTDPMWDEVASDGSDIRFVDGNETLLDHWTETWDYTNKSAEIWIKVPSIPANGSTNVYMRYGDAQVVNPSSATATMDFYDDFSGDMSKWSSICGSWSVSGGTLTLADNTNGRNAIVNNTGTFSAYKMVYRVKWNDADEESGTLTHVSATGGTHDRYETMFRGRAADDTFTTWRTGSNGCTNGSGSNVTSASLGFNPSTNTWYDIELHSDGSGWNAHYVNGSRKSSWTHTSRTSGYIGFTSWKTGIDIDWVYLRKYASAEPTVTIS